MLFYTVNILLDMDSYIALVGLPLTKMLLITVINYKIGEDAHEQPSRPKAFENVWVTGLNCAQLLLDR